MSNIYILRPHNIICFSLCSLSHNNFTSHYFSSYVHVERRSTLFRLYMTLCYCYVLLRSVSAPMLQLRSSDDIERLCRLTWRCWRPRAILPGDRGLPNELYTPHRYVTYYEVDPRRRLAPLPLRPVYLISLTSRSYYYFSPPGDCTHFDAWIRNNKRRRKML